MARNTPTRTTQSDETVPLQRDEPEGEEQQAVVAPREREAQDHDHEERSSQQDSLDAPLFSRPLPEPPDTIRPPWL